MFRVPVNYPSLNELVSMPELRCIPTQFRLPPDLCLCKLPLCKDSALSWPLGGPFSFPLKVEDHSEFHSKPEAFRHMSPHCWFSDLGPFRFRIFSAQVGNRTRAHGDEWNPLEISMSRYTLSSVHDSPVTETCVKRGSNRGQGPICFYCPTEGVAPLHTGPPVPVTAPPGPVT